MNIIEKLFINANTKQSFEKKLENGEILLYSIAFIKDTSEIWTLGKYYPCPYTKEEIQLIIDTLKTDIKVDKELLLQAINEEFERAKNLEELLDLKIKDEITRAKEKEELLELLINLLETSAVLLINNEVIRAKAEEDRLENSKADKNTVYTKEQVDQKVSSVYRVIGSSTFENLPTEGITIGDVYNITNDFTLNGTEYPFGTNIVWTENGWDTLSGVFDTTELENSISLTITKIDEESARAKLAELGLLNNFNNYLPLTGGTISGNLNIRGSSDTSALISFSDNDDLLGYIGISQTEEPIFYDKTRNFALKILTDNNYSNYALPLTGGTLTKNANGSVIVLNNNTTEVYMGFARFDVTKAWLGINSKNDLQYNKGDGFINVLHEGNYSDYALPLSGGKITSDKDAPVVNFTNTSYLTYIEFTKNDQYYRIGINDGRLVCNGTNSSKWNEIYHKGNDGEGSGLNADMLDGKHLDDFFYIVSRPIAPINLNEISEYKAASISWDSATHAFITNGMNIYAATVFQVPGSKGWQFIKPYGEHRLLFRDRYENEWYNWKEIAFTDNDITGNAATATKLATPVKLWGNDFDGSGDVNGMITFPAVSTLATIKFAGGEYIDGYGNIRIPAASNVWSVMGVTHGLSVKGNGNVGIGTIDPLYKLDVNGNVHSLNNYIDDSIYLLRTDGTYKSMIAIDDGNVFRLGFGNSTLNNTRIYGKNTSLYYNGENAGFILNESGNVTIGSSDLAGTDYKLYVDGNAYFTNIQIGSNGYLAMNLKDTFDDSSGVARPWYGLSFNIDKTSSERTILSSYYGMRFKSSPVYEFIFEGGNIIPASASQVLGDLNNKWANVYTRGLSSEKIELSYTTPFIDFHFDNSTEDYTSRIIEAAAGKLKCVGSWDVVHSVGIGDSLYVTDLIAMGDYVDWYGVSWSEDSSDPTCTRIGNMALHRSLPILSAMKGYMIQHTAASMSEILIPLNDDWEHVKYNTNNNDRYLVTSYGYGNTMVKIPEFWYIDDYESSTKTHNLKISQTAKAGWCHHKEAYVGAYEGYINDTYYRSKKGVTPTVSVSRTTLRSLARANGYEDEYKWNIYTYEEHRAICHLFLVEYATRNSQLAVNTELTANGFKQGGLGSGCTTGAVTINGVTTYSFIPTGTTDSLGNGSGQVAYTVTQTDADGNEIGTVTRYANRYRGIENPFGHIWKHVDDIVNVYNAESGNKTVYKCNKPEHFATNKNAKYKPLCMFPGGTKMQGKSKEIKATINCDFFKYSIGGSESTYWCDYNYDNDDTSEHCLLIGGTSGDSGRAGLFCSNLTTEVGISGVSIGSRLTYLPWVENDISWKVI